MKKRFLTLIVVAMVLVTTLSFLMTACFGNDDGGDNSANTETPSDLDKEYTIQYSTDEGVFTIKVKSGDLYAMETIPQKRGYTFVGLYDSETDGTQYVNAYGSSVKEFTDNKNIVLYPRFVPNEYTLVLEYQGAAVSGEREMKVSYGSKLTELPTNLVYQNKEFMGWYTQPDCKGVQIADQYGVIPDKSVVNENQFDLTDESGYIYLYAGFRGQMFNVTFNFGEEYGTEEMSVEYGTSISDLVPEMRVNGLGVYKWSTVANDTDLSDVFTGKITKNMVLYAAEFAPVIDFRTNGGDEIIPLVVPAGSPISLPTAIKDGYEFEGWYSEGGEKCNIQTMPETGITVFAKYKTVISLDSRGGSEVQDIVAFSDADIELPIPTKDGYIFAGWYNKGELYEATKMPSEHVELQAYWYKVQTKKILITEDTLPGSERWINTKDPNFRFTINLTEQLSEVDWSVPRVITIESEAFIMHESFDENDGVYATKEHFWLYSRKMAEEQYLLDYTIINHGNNGVDTAGKDMKWTTTITVPEGMIYIALSADKDTSKTYPYGGWRMKNYYWTIHYPDTSVLY